MALFVKRCWTLWALLCCCVVAFSAGPVSGQPASPSFAPMPASHLLAPIWNDPDFVKRLMGSYGFLSEAEPSMDAEEALFYKEKIVPLLRGEEKKGKQIPRDPAKAIPLIQARLKPGHSAQFDYLLGTIYLESGDLTNATKHFEAALVLAPDFRRAQKNLALTLVRSEKYEAAIKPLLRTIALGGGDGKVYGLLASIYMSRGQFASAEGAYKQALVHEPDNMDFKLGAIRCAVGSANYDHALAQLSELLKQYPDRTNLWTLHANIYIQKEQPAKAAVSLEMLRRLGKAAPQDLFLLGDLYMAQESRDLALTAYLEALEKDGGEKPAKALRAAQILVSRGAGPEAKLLFTKIRGSAIPLSAADELKLLKLESRVAMTGGEGEQAIKTLEAIIQKDPLDGEALLLAGDYYARHEQPEKAVFRYETAGKLPAFEAEASVKHAQLLVGTKKYPQAAELLRKAQKVKPRDNVQRYLEKVEQLARSSRS